MPLSGREVRESRVSGVIRVVDESTSECGVCWNMNAENELNVTVWQSPSCEHVSNSHTSSATVHIDTCIHLMYPFSFIISRHTPTPHP